MAGKGLFDIISAPAPVEPAAAEPAPSGPEPATAGPEPKEPGRDEVSAGPATATAEPAPVEPEASAGRADHEPAPATAGPSETAGRPVEPATAAAAKPSETATGENEPDELAVHPRDKWGKIYADRKRETERLRIAITKAIAAGEPAGEVLLLALECIAQAVGDNAFYTMNREKAITLPGTLTDEEPAGGPAGPAPAEPPAAG